MEKIVICNSQFGYYPELGAAVMAELYPAAQLLRASDGFIPSWEDEENGIIVLGQVPFAERQKEVELIWKKWGEEYVRLVHRVYFNHHARHLTTTEVDEIREVILTSRIMVCAMTWVGGEVKEYTLEAATEEVMNLQRELINQIGCLAKRLLKKTA